MDIQITGRNVTVSEGLKENIEGRLRPGLEDYPRVESCHVILSHEKYRFTANIVIQGRDHLRIEAEETTDDLHASIEVATEKVEKQLRKSREKMLDRHHDRQRLADLETEA
jgi:ribosome hibernation promoting factor